MSRHFIVKHKDSCNAEQSKFTSSEPKSAAKKIFNSLCKNKKPCKKVITVIDVNTQKSYKYRVERKIVNKTVMISGKPVLFKYDTKATSLKK